MFSFESSDDNLQPLCDFTLPCNSSTFAIKYLSHQWTDHFLRKELADINISISPWDVEADRENSVSRVVKSSHKSNVSFPGLSSHAENVKKQILCIQQNGRKLILLENTSFSGIPYSDYFVVNMKWMVETIEDYSQPLCRVQIHVDIVFMKSTWLRGTIESNTKAELRTVCELWRVSAENACSLEEDDRTIVWTKDTDTTLCDLFNTLDIPSNSNSDAKIMHHSGDTDKNIICENVSDRLNNDDSQQILSMSTLTRVSSRVSSNSGATGTEDEDDEAMYFDCIDLSAMEEAGMDRVSPSGSYYSPVDRQEPPIYSIGSGSSYKEIAINAVDMIFILIEFFFWKVLLA